MTYLRKTDEYKVIGDFRAVFEEVKEGPDIFPEFQREVLIKKNPSLLFCVIGGKLSEGINFSDDLARTLVVCGLPFANSQSTEIQEKMKYYDKVGDMQFRGGDYYENLCMKTLNQAIGRAIRHINDYATIVLVDSRFTGKNIQKKLPKWINERLIEVKHGQESQQISSLI